MLTVDVAAAQLLQWVHRHLMNFVLYSVTLGSWPLAARSTIAG